MWTKQKRRLVEAGWSREWIAIKQGIQNSRRLANETRATQKAIAERLNRQANKGRATIRAIG